jgi:hypothetical protein
VLDGVAGALGVPEDEGGGVLVADAVGSEDTVTELPVAVGVVGGPEVESPVPAVVVGDEVEVSLGDASGVGVVLGYDGLVAGRGRGAWGLSLAGSWGSRKKPTPSPATARTEPTAFCAARARRRARTPARRRVRCFGSKGVCSWVSRINRANSRSK